MIEISKPQYKLLVKIKKGKITSYKDLTNEQEEILEFLTENNCIVAASFTQNGFVNKGKVVYRYPERLKITQFGEACIYAFRAKFYKWWIPLLVSIAALGWSIASPFLR